MVLLLLSSASLLLLPLFFVCSVNNILPSLRWSRAMQLVTAKRKNGAAAGGFRRVSPSFFVSAWLSLSVFVSAWLSLSVFVFASSSVSHGAGVVINDGEGGGS